MPDAPPQRPTRLLAGNRKIGALLGLGVVLLLVAVTTASLSLRQVVKDGRWVEHTLLVEAAINRAAAANEQTETARRGYIISGSPGFLRTFEGSERALTHELATIRRLVSDNPLQLARANRLRALDAERSALLRAQFASGQARTALMGGARFDADRGVLLLRQMRVSLTEMGAEEARLLTVRSRGQFESLITLYSLGGATLLLLLTVLGMVIFLILRYNRSLTVAQTLLRRANEGLEDAVTARTTELTRANDEIQRFAYIVSHDLRSPLVNVLGFTSELDQARKTLRDYLEKLFEERPELNDRAAWLAVEEDLPEALGFIRTSTEKMDRLINSILELSRQGRRTLTSERLDMDRLAEGVAATMKQRAETAGATIALAPLPAIESDRMAIEQILSNLVENALKYLSPARAGEVRIEGRKTGNWVEIDVIDNGRGIAPADHERIFDLFRRAGAQDQTGEGIGLANVRALAYRLGGRVDVESQLDQGARFILTLPEKFVATEPSA